MTFLGFLFWVWVAGNVLGTVFILWLCWDEIVWRCRRAWKFLGFTRQREGRCWDCGARLDTDEVEFYGTSCNRCEGVWMKRMDAAMRDTT